MKKITLFIVTISTIFSINVANAFDWKAHSGKTITILMNEHPVLDGIRSLIPQFEEDTGIKVKVNALAEDPELWNDQIAAQKLMKERTYLEQKLSSFSQLELEFKDIITIIEIAEQDEDEELLLDAKNQLIQLNFKKILSRSIDLIYAILGSSSKALFTPASSYLSSERLLSKKSP